MLRTSGMANDKCDTIITKIKNAEDSIQSSFLRVETIEKKLRSRHLSVQDREQLEKELEAVKQLLKKNESQLKHLQKENRKSFVVAAIIMFLCFLAYSLVYGVLWTTG